MSDDLSHGERLALDSIAGDLAVERHRRRLRALAAAIASFSLVVVLIVTAAADASSNTRMLMIAASGVLFALWFSMSLWTSVRMPPLAAHAIALAAVSVPLLAAPEHASGPEPSHLKCSALVLVSGLVLFLALRRIMGRYARRFGGAEELAISYASILGALVIGLRCSGVSMVHLAAHCAGALLLIGALKLWSRAR